MNCKTAYKIIISYEDFIPDSSINKELKSHLNICNNCNKLFADMEATYSLLNSREFIPDNPFLYNKITDKLNAIEENSTQAFLLYNRVVQPVLFSLVIVFSVILGITIGNTNYKTQREVSEQSQIEYYFNDLKIEPIEATLLNE